MLRLCFLLAFVSKLISAKGDLLEVTLPNGSKLLGHDKYRSEIKGRKIFSYQGIPYAKPPVEDLRFTKPEEAPVWQGVLQADKQYKCSQLEFPNLDYAGEEDCLYLNVYVPEGARKPLPVMFWIHGGGWFAWDGTTDLFGPDRLLDKDVILVTTNYRLGPLGFLTMLNDDLPANLGLLDQQLAMKWVQKNIKAFGGDPDRVTIFGESAGSASVLLHVLSPSSKGLFQAAIAESGSPLASWATLDRHPAYYARSIASRLGCEPENSSNSIKDCLRKASIYDLVTNQKIGTNVLDTVPLHFIPVVDGDDGFLPKSPLQLMKSGDFSQVPIIMGFNKDEALFLMWNYMVDQSKLDSLNNDLHKNLISLFLGKSSSIPAQDPELKLVKSLLIEKIKARQIVQGEGGSLEKLTQMLTDTWFNAIGMRTSQLMADSSKAPVYEYLFNHEGTSTSFVDLQVIPTWKHLIKAVGRYFGLNLFHDRWGVCHVDELFLIFKSHALPYDTLYSDEDRAASDNLIELWTNFATTVQTPTPDRVSGVIWERLNPKNPQRLVINSSLSFGPRSEDEVARLHGWKELWENFPPYDYLMKQNIWQQSELLYENKGNVKKEKLEL